MGKKSKGATTGGAVPTDTGQLSDGRMVTIEKRADGKFYIKAAAPNPTELWNWQVRYDTAAKRWFRVQ